MLRAIVRIIVSVLLLLLLLARYAIALYNDYSGIIWAGGVWT